MPRLFRERIVLENLRDENIASIYRLSKGGIERLLVLIGEDIAPTRRRPFIPSLRNTTRVQSNKDRVVADASMSNI
ncbi:hypothetical protein DPMN_147194 [Dreissena polymorpha]|uniref:Uncharacterized protein n=1 Tax=Dreissena polymorpha TaxID=45954 RepID=A0A9D4FBS2_DREPO|nr:hypothetical protein DPMN_147194 [Dreissena polymorpha]